MVAAIRRAYAQLQYGKVLLYLYFPFSYFHCFILLTCRNAKHGSKDKLRCVPLAIKLLLRFDQLPAPPSAGCARRSGLPSSVACCQHKNFVWVIMALIYIYVHPASPSTKTDFFFLFLSILIDVNALGQ